MGDRALITRLRHELKQALEYAARGAAQLAQTERELAALRREARATKRPLEARIVRLQAELFRTVPQGDR